MRPPLPEMLPEMYVSAEPFTVRNVALPPKLMGPPKTRLPESAENVVCIARARLELTVWLNVPWLMTLPARVIVLLEIVKADAPAAKTIPPTDWLVTVSTAVWFEPAKQTGYPESGGKLQFWARFQFSLPAPPVHVLGVSAK